MRKNIVIIAALVFALAASSAFASEWVFKSGSTSLFTTGSYHKVIGFDENNLIVMGYKMEGIDINFEYVFRSADAGLTVEPIFDSGVLASGFLCKSFLLVYDMHFTNMTNGLVFGEWGKSYSECGLLTSPANYVASTATGGGQDWGPIALDPVINNAELTAVDFYDDNFGVAAGEWDNIWTTENGGGTWTLVSQQSVEYAGTAVSVSAPSTSNLWIAAAEYPEDEDPWGDDWDDDWDDDMGDDDMGDDDAPTKSTDDLDGFNGTLVHSFNGGLSWETVATDENMGFHQVQFIDNDKGWLLALNDEERLNELRYTTDGGESWTTAELPQIQGIGYPGDNYLIAAFQMLDENVGWAVGGDYDDASVILKTSDGGVTWQADDYAGEGFLQAVHMIDGRRGWASGDDITIVQYLRTANEVPVADAGDDESVQVGSDVTLDGTASYDADGDQLTYLWTQLEGPSAITFDDNTSATPRFNAAEKGAYEFQLVVNDGFDPSNPDWVNIQVVSDGGDDDDDDDTDGDDDADDDDADGDDDDDDDDGGCCG